MAFGSGAAVTAHRRHDERLGPQTAEAAHQRSQNHRDAGDAPAAGRDRYLRARLQAGRNPALHDGGVYRRRNVVNGLGRKTLSYTGEPRHLHRVPPGTAG